MLRSFAGFILEGHGEYNCYPSIITRSLDVTCMKIPSVNAGGITNIFAHFDEQLCDLLTVDKPYHVYICFDQIDVLKRYTELKTSQDIISHINTLIESWKSRYGDIAKYQPLPDKFTAILQVKKFESWIVADVEGLNNFHLLNSGEFNKNFDNVETDVDDPHIWLLDNVDSKYNSKNPIQCKKLISAIDVNRASKSSPSLLVFLSTLREDYSTWVESFV